MIGLRESIMRRSLLAARLLDDSVNSELQRQNECLQAGDSKNERGDFYEGMIIK